MAHPLRVCAFVVLAGLLFAPLNNPTLGGEYRTPIVFKSTTTIVPGPNPVFDMVTGTPADFILELIPAGGTLRIRLDGDIVATWNEVDVVPGTSFNIDARLETNPSSVGEVAVEYSYLLRPGFRIDWESLFRGSSYWGAEDSVLQAFPDTGTIEDRFPLTGEVPEVRFRRKVSIPPTDSVFLLAGSYTWPGTLEDTQRISITHSPFPCVRLHAAATIRTSLYFDVGTDSVCIRHAPPGDTLCWAAQDDFLCQLMRQPPWRFPVWVPCEEVYDFVVPFCPVNAGCRAQVNIDVTVVLDTLELSYETVGRMPCSGSTSLIQASPDTMGSPLVDQYLTFGTDRDDAIFTVPVPLKHVDVDLVNTSGDTLAEFAEVSAGYEYRIAWVSIDEALAYCCDSTSSYYESSVFYRNSVQDTVACWDEIAAGVPGDTLGYSWVVPAPAEDCPSDGDTLRVYIDFYCPNSGKVLHRAWSDLLIYRE